MVALHSCQAPSVATQRAVSPADFSQWYSVVSQVVHGSEHDKVLNLILSVMI
jgi:hypothetical protein